MGLLVVADTTPLRYLVVIQREYVLPALYGHVLIPPAVAKELNHQSTPESVRVWLATPPDWLEVRQPARAFDSEVDLDEGELQAIALAEEVAADLLLIDERDGRLEAQRRHLRVVGTLRVLADAASLGLIDLAESFGRLRHTNFRASPGLLESLLDESRQRGRE